MIIKYLFAFGTIVNDKNKPWLDTYIDEEVIFNKLLCLRILSNKLNIIKIIFVNAFNCIYVTGNMLKPL